MAEECLEDNDKDFEKATACYLKKQEVVWGQWMSPEACKKVRDALQKE